MISVKNLSKKYGNFLALDNVSFEIKKGEIIGLLGPNGAGKSTTMNLLTGYIEPTSGQIIINGFDMSKKPKKAKSCIGYMPENIPLYKDLTVSEFVYYMGELKKVKKIQIKTMSDNILSKLNLNNVKNTLIKNLSRGYKQRVSLAGALIGSPEVLIFDEPTVGLDPKQITEIRDYIKELHKTHTILISSHILSEISLLCDKVIIINNGKLLAIDSPKNLESQVTNSNAIIITIEDNENKFESVVNTIDNISHFKLLSTNDDNTKQYSITPKGNSDIRKNIFELLSKENISIIEFKKSEITLEDAFLNLISGKGGND